MISFTGITSLDIVICAILKWIAIYAMLIFIIGFIIITLTCNILKIRRLKRNMPENVINNEQWKANQKGDCNLCRRRTYCAKQCKNSKNFIMDYVLQVYKEELEKEMNKETNKEDNAK